jgi:putative chitinase
MSTITATQLAAMIPTNKEVDGWCEALNALFPKFGIATPKRIAGFISQCAHESADFKLLEENLNYKEETLLRVFPRYFGPGKRNAAEYARNPEKIANYVYMDEHRSASGALGNTKPGDGWLFRGRGLKQVTGRANYTAFGKDFGMTAEQAVDYLQTKEGALASALWFWNSRNLNAIADTGDVAALTKKINGGDIGLDDRRNRYARAIQALAGQAAGDAPSSSSSSSTSANPNAAKSTLGLPLRRGSKGADVATLQKALGLTADGDFGPGTEAAVKAWQAKEGLTADGIVGPKSWAKLTA